MKLIRMHKFNIIYCEKEVLARHHPQGERRTMNAMTDKQMQFIAWLITTATDKCQSMEEVREMNREIRKYSAGLKTENENGEEKTE